MANLSPTHEEIYKEFKALSRAHDKSQFSIALLHPRENRYSTILPYNQSRVRLSHVDHHHRQPHHLNHQDSLEPYINGSYIPEDFQGGCRFIATQAPIPSTMYNFWKMVWEHKVPQIIMLTRIIEKRRVKAHRYWPNTCINDPPWEFHDISVTFVHQENIQDIFIVTILQIQKGDEIRKVRHIQFYSWSDHTIPDNTSDILHLLDYLRTFTLSQQLSLSISNDIRGCSKKKHYTVVHCSAGVGRSGTFIAIYKAIEHLDRYTIENLSVFDIVQSLRLQRMNMVQRPEQYRFIYDVIHDYVTSNYHHINHQRE